MTLEFSQYDVITAENGEKALKCLSEIEKIPDLIVSDIMMPEMNGYEFFKTVSDNLKLYEIPFIFLTALDSPEDIRLGKLLGVDDYLTKPVNEDDLLATVKGKIKKRKNIELINQKLNNFFKSYKYEFFPSISTEEKEKILLIEVVWDDLIGPKVIKYYPQKENPIYSINKIGMQLFDAATSIYGQNGFENAEGILVNLRNLNLMSYALFDSFPEQGYRAGERQYMLAVISPKITYFHSLKLKNILREISESIKKKKNWKIEQYWDKISEDLSQNLT